MNSLVLITISFIIFALGVKFFGKFLSLVLFSTEQEEYQHSEGSVSAEVAVAHGLFAGHHTSVAVSLVTIPGVILATFWGWIPAFLWILTATVLAGGTYIVGAMWLSQYQSDDGDPDPIHALLGTEAALVLLFVGYLLLLLLNTFLLLSTVELIAQREAALVPLFGGLCWTFLVIQTIKVKKPIQTVSLLGAGLLFLLAAVWLGNYSALAVSGEIAVGIGRTAFSLSEIHLLIGMFLAGLYFVVRKPAHLYAKPRGALTALLLILLLILGYLGLAMGHPVVTAPGYSPVAGLPTAFPLIFLVVTGGALIGFHGLLAGGGSSLPKHFHASAITRTGYGSAVLDGMLAVLVLLVAICAADTPDLWLEQHQQWPGQIEVTHWLLQFNGQLAVVFSNLGLSAEYAATLTTLILVSLGLTTLECGLRIQSYIHDDIRNRYGRTEQPLRHTIKTIVILVGLMAIVLHAIGLDYNFFVFLGELNQLFACVIMIAIANALIRLRRPHWFVTIPLIFLLPLICAATLYQLYLWWQDQLWVYGFLSIVLLCASLFTVYKSGKLLVQQWLKFRQLPPPELF